MCLKINALFHRKERLSPTLWGWLLIFLVIISGVTCSVLTIHPFLAINKPVKADILLVEGWMPDYALRKAMQEFNSGAYKLLITTGIPLTTGHYLSQYKTFPEMAAATLKQMGFDENKLAAVPAPNVIRDGTYASLVACRQWLTEKYQSLRPINVCSFGAHARRTWLLTEKAMQSDVPVGIISIESLDYDPNAWWKSSKGVRAVIGETIAYIYTRFIF